LILFIFVTAVFSYSYSLFLVLTAILLGVDILARCNLKTYSVDGRPGQIQMESTRERSPSRLTTIPNSHETVGLYYHVYR